MYDPMTMIGIAAIAGVGLSAYSYFSQPAPPSMGPPPAPASYFQYNDDGSVTTQKWDEASNSYITETNAAPELHLALTPEQEKTLREKKERGEGVRAGRIARGKDPMAWEYRDYLNYKDKLESDFKAGYDAWKAGNKEGLPSEWTSAYEDYDSKIQKYTELQEFKEKDTALRQEIRTKMLSNLNETPEDRVKAYEEYADTMSEAMHKDVDKRFEEYTQAEREDMAARGLFGSRAHVDTMSEIREDKAATDSDIAEKSQLAKETLAQQDKNFWLTTLAELDAGRRGDVVAEGQRAYQAAQGAQMGTSATLGRYLADQDARLRKWETRVARSRDLTDTLTNTATGLAYLYGYNKPGGASGAPLSAPTPRNAYTSGNYYLEGIPRITY